LKRAGDYGSNRGVVAQGFRLGGRRRRAPAPSAWQEPLARPSTSPTCAAQLDRGQTTSNTPTLHLRRTEDQTDRKPAPTPLRPPNATKGYHYDANMAGIKTIIGLSFVRRIRAPSRISVGAVLTSHIIDPRDRLPPRHPLGRALQELHDAPRCRNLRNRTPTQLALRTSSESR
jgi:hypothetical protein